MLLQVILQLFFIATVGSFTLITRELLEDAPEIVIKDYLYTGRLVDNPK
jgi:hypothetical protein